MILDCTAEISISFSTSKNNKAKVEKLLKETNEFFASHLKGSAPNVYSLVPYEESTKVEGDIAYFTFDTYVASDPHYKFRQPLYPQIINFATLNFIAKLVEIDPNVLIKDSYVETNGEDPKLTKVKFFKGVNDKKCQFLLSEYSEEYDEDAIEGADDYKQTEAFGYNLFGTENCDGFIKKEDEALIEKNLFSPDESLDIEGMDHLMSKIDLSKYVSK